MKPTESQNTRSLNTQISLMEAAENLVAKNGIQAVTIKEIVREAGQKNESALQYHFKNVQGLINAIHQRRSEQTREKRDALLASLMVDSSNPSLRDLCGIMVLPSFQLAKSDAQYRRYIAGFSHEIILAEDSALSKINKSGGGGESGVQTGVLLRAALPRLDEMTYRARMDLALRMCSAAMRNHAKQKNAFKGANANFFVANLIDALEGLLSIPVSSDTQSHL